MDFAKQTGRYRLLTQPLLSYATRELACVIGTKSHDNFMHLRAVKFPPFNEFSGCREGESQVTNAIMLPMLAAARTLHYHKTTDKLSTTIS
jgi:hypothetical protein